MLVDFFHDIHSVKVNLNLFLSHGGLCSGKHGSCFFPVGCWLLFAWMYFLGLEKFKQVDAWFT